MSNAFGRAVIQLGQRALQAVIRRLQATQRGEAPARPEPAHVPAATPGPPRTLELLTLLDDIPEYALRRGEVGIVVRWHIAAAQYEVEFSATNARARALVTVSQQRLTANGKKT